MFSGIWENLFGSSDKIKDLLIHSGMDKEKLLPIENNYHKLALQKKIDTNFVVEVKNSSQVGAICQMLGPKHYALNQSSVNIDICSRFSWHLLSDLDSIKKHSRVVIFTDSYCKENWNHVDHVSIGFSPNNKYEYVFIENASKDNIGDFFNYNVIGFYYKTFFNSKFNTKNTLQQLFNLIINNPKEKIGKKKTSNAEDNIKNSKISLMEIMYILNQMDTLLNNPIVSRFIGGKISPQQLKQLKVLRAFIQSLTAKEQVNPNILKKSHFKRISRGINKSEAETEKFCEICKMLLKQMGPFITKMKNDPSEMMNLMKSGNLQSVMNALSFKK